MQYDIAEFSAKAKEALKKLETSQQPGQIVGKGGKSDVVKMVGDEIKALLEKGYTAQQIAKAFKDDVFSILPKTITELITGGNEPKKAKAKSPRKKAATKETKPATTVLNVPAAAPPKTTAQKPITDIGGDVE
jgi:hypothetical protein